jgi:hypothetical protein
VLAGAERSLWAGHILCSAVDGYIPSVSAVQKEIVMYAYYKRLDYFSTECVYAPFAARGFARDFVKDLEVGCISAS